MIGPSQIALGILKPTEAPLLLSLVPLGYLA